MDITNGEQYSKWFLAMNPKAEVPVLKHDTLIVPESGRIISYLEENFPDGKKMFRNNNKIKKKNIFYLLFYQSS